MNFKDRNTITHVLFIAVCGHPYEIVTSIIFFKKEN